MSAGSFTGRRGYYLVWGTSTQQLSYRSNMEQVQPGQSKRVFYASVFAACLNGVAVGNLAGWPQAAIPKLLSPSQNRAAFGESEVSWIAGIFFLGMLSGGFASLVVAGRFGKRKLFLLASVPLLLGWSIIAVGVTFWELVFGRIILGLGGGMICHQTEMYLSEIVPQRLRSSMSVAFCACVHVGVLLSFGIGPHLSISSATAVYLMVVLMLAGLYLGIAPETPFWLVRHGQVHEALESLRKLRGTSDVHAEFQSVVEFVENSIVASKSDGFWTGFKRVVTDAANRRAILLVVLLTTAQQFSGMAAMHSYAQLIFERSVKLIEGRHVSLLIGLVELGCTLGSGFLVERVGRRPLVAASCTICTGCMAIMGTYFHSMAGQGQDNDRLAGALPVVCIVLFALAYGLGLATMATVVAAECLSIDARNLGAAAQNTTVGFSIFLVTKLWQVIATTYGQEYSFWAAAFITGAHTIVLLIILPETRGRSLVEIQRLLASPDKTKSTLLCVELRTVKVMPTESLTKSNRIQIL